ncbi:ATP-binding protein [Candidatus Omnitrophota bacterium]
MKELTVISGKGGTGKTTIVASFAVLAQDSVLADCDVDAADLHLILKPNIRRREDFSGGSVARIKPGHCTACGKCEELCLFDAVFFDGPGNGTYPKTYRIDPVFCEGCGVCAWFCAENAIEFKPAVNGQWFISETRCGPMVHARLGIAEENSGKLVTIVRNAARKIAEHEKLKMVIVDGSPGIGCPVIASVTGADYVLAVTEPTLSGLHDLERVIELAEFFSIPIGVAINKSDINEFMTLTITEKMQSKNIDVLGKIRYDNAVTTAMVHGKSVVEFDSSPVAGDIESLWKCVSGKLTAITEKKT